MTAAQKRAAEAKRREAARCEEAERVSRDARMFLAGYDAGNNESPYVEAGEAWACGYALGKSDRIAAGKAAMAFADTGHFQRWVLRIGQHERS